MNVLSQVPSIDGSLLAIFFGRNVSPPSLGERITNLGTTFAVTDKLQFLPVVVYGYGILPLTLRENIC
jgi:hypothetical protein